MGCLLKLKMHFKAYYFDSYSMSRLLIIAIFLTFYLTAAEQNDVSVNSDSPLASDESPVLLDESNSFEHVKPDFRNLDATKSIELEARSQEPYVQDQDISEAVTITHELEKEEMLNQTAASVIQSNSTLNETLSEKNSTEAKYKCSFKVYEEGEQPTLQLMNSSSLLRALSPVPNVTTGECSLVIFYSPWCIFSAKAAPQFNALPRLFPDFSIYALDVVTYPSLNMRYGLVAIPTFLLFYNGKAVARFNESEPVVEKITIFVQKYTGITASGNLTISEDEYLGPLAPVPAERRDYILILSWLIIIICSCGWFLQSSICQKMVEGLRNTWREAEAQHEHVE